MWLTCDTLPSGIILLGDIVLVLVQEEGGGGHGVVVVVVVTSMKQRQLLGLSLSLVFDNNDLFAFSESPCRGKRVYLVKMVSLYDHFYDMNSC